MGQVIPFIHRQSKGPVPKPVENPRVLLFTGVRYERGKAPHAAGRRKTQRGGA